jgi:hypothetical protein
MSEQIQHKGLPKRFFGYPKATEGPKITYSKRDDANPVFAGIVLVIGAWL